MNSEYCFVPAVAGFPAFGGPALADTYGPFPVTVREYSGDKSDSTSCTGQAARQVLHDSLRKLAGKGGGSNAAGIKSQMMAYYAVRKEGRAIPDPKSRDGFVVLQTEVDQISRGRGLKGKACKDVVSRWSGKMTGSGVIGFMVDQATSTRSGLDPLTGYSHLQLISGFAMSAVLCNQAVDNCQQERLAIGNRPGSEGRHHVGKEHSRDEAFGMLIRGWRRRLPSPLVQIDQYQGN